MGIRFGAGATSRVVPCFTPVPSGTGSVPPVTLTGMKIGGWMGLEITFGCVVIIFILW